MIIENGNRQSLFRNEIDIEIPSEEELRKIYNMLKEEERQLARAKHPHQSFGWIIIPAHLYIFQKIKKMAYREITSIIKYYKHNIYECVKCQRRYAHGCPSS